MKNKQQQDSKTLANEWWSKLDETEQYYFASKNGIDVLPEVSEREVLKIYLSENPTTTPKETAPTEGKKEDEPKDLIDWIGKKGLSGTKDILNELKVINLTKENESLKQRNKELLEAMTELVERVNRARGILQDPKGNHHGYWGMLDTTNAKEKIEANQIK